MPENLLRKVQSVQNAAARLLTNAWRRDHAHHSGVATTSLAAGPETKLEFKIACNLIVHQSLAPAAPTYLSADIHLAPEHGRHLRSSSYRSLAVSRTRTTFGDRSLTIAASQDRACGTVCRPGLPFGIF